MEVLTPMNIINKKHLSCANLIVFFPNVINRDDFQNMDDEWLKIRLFRFSELGLDEKVAVDKFWYEILELKLSDGTFCFPHLKRAFMAIFLNDSGGNGERRTYFFAN